MKNNLDKNIAALFQKVKEIPTEIPLDKMEKMILNFPDHPMPIPETHWFAKLFNLKYITMIIIPFIAILSFWFVPNQSDFEPLLAENKIEQIANSTTTGTEDPVVVESLKKVPLPQKESTTPTPFAPNSKATKARDLPKPNPLTIDKKPTDLTTNLIEPSPTNNTDTIREIPIQITNYPPAFIRPDILSDDPTPISEISSPRLKKLRRTLFKHLLADGLIPNKFTFVELVLMPDKIILNDQAIPEALLIKYLDLTKIIGVGPARKIKMNRELIIAGDFFETGFKGSGIGTFSSELLEQKEELFHPFSISKKIEEKKELLEIEDKALNLFAKEIRSITPAGTGRKRLFSPNLNGKQTKDLHTELKILLAADNFIDEKDEFAVIQLPKKIIRINGQNLSGAQLAKYEKLMKEYKIKHGRTRMILFSPHILKVGNFREGSFSGTTSLFRLD